MDNSAKNLQDAFLNIVRQDKIPVTIFLMNGFQFKGIVKAFDGFTVLIDVESRQQLLYKHAISTIIPSKNIEFSHK
ncbi:MAG: RNA chaperone Hfq [Clostridia bacterium]|nr:RNA chaperone Hfq [Clostridia bacterium]